MGITNNYWPCQQTAAQALVERIALEVQVEQDTCEEHGVFCCEQCFDVSPMDTEKPWLVWWKLQDEEMLCLATFATQEEAEAYREGREAEAGAHPAGVEGRGLYVVEDSRQYFR